MNHVPISAPMAALRAVRRAAWGETPLAHLHDARAQLTEPLGRLAVAWVRFCEAFDAYTDAPSADRWDDLCDALFGFDEVCAAFFGPSGWEQARRPTRDRPPGSQTSKP